MTDASPRVVAVARDSAHRFSKPARPAITLLEGLGVEGDAHAGETVQHLHRLRTTPGAPNLRQVHLIHRELFDELEHEGFRVEPGGLGENVTTVGVDLLALPQGTRLHLGSEAVVEVTGLRNPCSQINGLESGLMKALIRRRADGSTERRAGIMSIVLRGGVVRAGDPLAVELPTGERRALAVV